MAELASVTGIRVVRAAGDLPCDFLSPQGGETVAGQAKQAARVEAGAVGRAAGEWFAGNAPARVWATLLDAGVYLRPESTRHRLSRATSRTESETEERAT